jgi:Zn-finger nucleic acid-binding protein
METPDCNGFCICPECNTRIEHKCGKPCRAENCPVCGKAMMREGNYHHLLYLKKMNDLKPNKDNN